MASPGPSARRVALSLVGMAFVVSISLPAMADDNEVVKKLTEKPGLFKSITNPPCSYCVVQHRKGLIKQNDRVIAWLRSSHNGGAIPLRHMLAAPRVINDTYGIFFYDPDGGYVSAFERSPGYKHTYEFHGWRNGLVRLEFRVSRYGTEGEAQIEGYGQGPTSSELDPQQLRDLFRYPEAFDGK